MTTLSYPVKQSSHNLTIIAWIVTLLISTLPDIAWIELTGSLAAWVVTAKIGLLIILSVASFL